MIFDFCMDCNSIIINRTPGEIGAEFWRGNPDGMLEEEVVLDLLSLIFATGVVAMAVSDPFV